MWHPHNLDEWVKSTQILSYCITPLIAAVVAVIGFRIQTRQGKIQAQQAEIQKSQARIQEQQAETQHQQYRLALFDKRMKVFNSVTNAIAQTLNKPEVRRQDFMEMWVESRDHTLLFGPEIEAFIKEVYKRGTRLAVSTDAMPNEAARKVDLEERNEIILWFEKQLRVAEEKFGPYIDFRKP